MSLNKIISLDSLDGVWYNKHIQQVKGNYAWNFTKGKYTKVVVIDTGVSEHDDLTDSFQYGINMYDRTSNVEDYYGHGTAVAGLISGKNTGIAPETELYVIKVLDDDGSGYADKVSNGITFATSIRADVLCMSLGISGRLPVGVKQLIVNAVEKGVTVVSAVGNSGVYPPQYPAFMDEVIGVGGCGDDLVKAQFSNYGNELDILAPAVNITTTSLDGKYCKMSGTSMASPIVAGGIALIISYLKMSGLSHSPKDIRRIIQESHNKDKNIYRGYGVLDLEKVFDNINKT